VALKPTLGLESNWNEYLELGFNIGVLLYQVEANAFKKGKVCVCPSMENSISIGSYLVVYVCM
jgi:hypothetical protein